MGLELSLLHFNHLLRGEESNGDEEFVLQKGEEYGYPVICRTIDVREYARKHKTSLQNAGHQMRYGIYEELLRRGRFQKAVIATVPQAKRR
ncbi:MAG: hypothetical protein DSY83_01785 [Flavobacteriia bacterium]|nr:MAG: hypothetical protein DSY83_01785 [Flavobacteriia bacterium]